MQIELSDISGLPETLKPLVATADGKTTLDLSKLMPAEDLTGLKTALLRERENAGAYARFGKPDEIAAKIADLEAKAAKGGKGGEEAQAKLDAMAKESADKISAAETKYMGVLTRYAQAELKAELSKAGVVPEGLDMLATFAAQRIRFNDDGTVKVVTQDGKPMIGSGADHGATLGDLAKELATAMPYLVKDAGVGGGGKPPGQGGGKPGQSTVTRAQWDAMDHGARAAHSKSGGKVVD
jgi:hypothetical protein